MNVHKRNHPVEYSREYSFNIPIKKIKVLKRVNRAHNLSEIKERLPQYFQNPSPTHKQESMNQKIKKYFSILCPEQHSFSISEAITG